MIYKRVAASLASRRKLLAEFFIKFNAHPDIRLVIGKIRYFWLSRVSGIQTLKGKDSRRNTVAHNLTAFKNFSNDFTMPRMEWLIKAVTSIEFAHRNSRFLVIGPRTESDILRLKGDGFRDVTGLDLISYSKDIILGDMHNMPFPENNFDIVIMGWTLSYSANPSQVADEILRVTRPGGLVAIGVEHLTLKSQHLNRGGLLDPLDDCNRINTVDQIIGLFGSSVKNIFFRHDAPLSDADPFDIVAINGLNSSQVMTVFQVK